MAKKKTVYRDSPFGTAVYPHLNTPDGKFNPENPQFKVDLRLTEEEAQPLIDLIDAAAEEAFEELVTNSDMKPVDKKKWDVFKPYEHEEDDDGNPTGYVLFRFRQNSKIKLSKTGEIKDIKLGLYDAAGKPMTKIIFGGSEIRVNYSMRDIKIASSKLAGVRLDFGRVQVKKLGEGSGGGGFGAVDGYEDDGQDDEDEGFKPASSGPVGDGDY